jgi:DNA-binding HxlR family transcriptional regulator
MRLLRGTINTGLISGEFSASRSKVRAGARVLPMAANSIKRRILRELLDRRLRLGPGSEFEITAEGKEMLFVAFVIERWLHSAPGGPIDFDSQEARAAVAALVDGWCSTVMHLLAREPLTLLELDRSIDGLSHRALKRRLDAMQRAGLVEARPSDGEGGLYAVTDWLRAGIAPLIAAARLERRKPREDMAPIADLDVEAGFMLSLPLLQLPPELSGSCRLGIEMPEEEPSHLVGATACVEQGRITSCAVRLDLQADAWAAGSAVDWLDTLIEPDTKRVRAGGDRWLALALLDALHGTLFGVPVR